MLVVNPDERLSAAQALEHPWFANYPMENVYLELPFYNISRYISLEKFQKTVIAFIATRTPDIELQKERQILFLSAVTGGPLDYRGLGIKKGH